MRGFKKIWVDLYHPAHFGEIQHGRQNGHRKRENAYNYISMLDSNMKMVSTHMFVIPGNPFISFISVLVLSVTLKSNMASKMAARIEKRQ